MPKSLLEQLPKIVAEGRQQAERILESLESRHRVALQTREWVLPSKDTAAGDWIAAAQRRAQLQGHDVDGDADWHNRLIYGDNLLAMAALLAGDANTPSLRGQVDLLLVQHVVCVRMRAEHRRGGKALLADEGQERCERRARVDENGRAAALVADDVGVREVPGMHASADQHGR